MESSAILVLVLSIIVCISKPFLHIKNYQLTVHEYYADRYCMHDIVFQTYAQDSCGTIGNSNESMVIKSSDRMFYLNTANPAPCTRNITSWRVCYYGPDSTIGSFSLRSYWATYAVYRKVNTGREERYVRVSEIFKAVRASALVM